MPGSEGLKAQALGVPVACAVSICPKDERGRINGAVEMMGNCKMPGIAGARLAPSHRSCARLSQLLVAAAKPGRLFLRDLNNVLRISLLAVFMHLAPPVSAESRPTAIVQIEEYVDAYVEMAAFDGVVLIAEGDSAVYQRAFGRADYRFGTPLEPDARFRIASLSKQVTDYLIGKKVDAERADLDAPLADTLADFPNAERITLRHLIEHTSGVAHTNRLEWMDMGTPMTLSEIMASLAEEPLSFDPGTDSAYSNGGYAVLAAAVEALYRRPFKEVVRTHVAEAGYPSIGHEDGFEVIPQMVHRYAPGPSYGTRVEATPYVTANRIGGGSLYANAEDVWRFFRATYRGDALSAETTQALFPRPSDGDVFITGRSPGALAQVYYDLEDDFAVVTLSSNSGWPGSFNADIVALYRGEDVQLTPFTLDPKPLSGDEIKRVGGNFRAQRFGWEVRIDAQPSGAVFVQGDLRTAFGRTVAGEYHLPVYDWLCAYAEDGSSFTCRQRDPDADIRFSFERVP